MSTAQTILLQLQSQLNDIDEQLSQLISQRGKLLTEIKTLDPSPEELFSIHEKEKKLLDQFKSMIMQSDEPAKQSPPLLVSREHQATDTVIRLRDTVIGDGATMLIAGPCAVESYDQVREVAQALARSNVKVMRGGAFKPRTSPYDFQGLGMDGLKILKEAADEFDLRIVSEIVSTSDLEEAIKYIDVIQIGARNMQNFDLLKAAGDLRVPVLLKRGMSATLEEFMLAAEYILSRGNEQVMLIERGIRTYETWTRNTLDISAVPVLKQETHLPVLVDVTHATGRKEIMLPCAKAAFAAGADGVMIEVHPNPPRALSDAKQQLNIPQFEQFIDELHRSGWCRQ